MNCEPLCQRCVALRAKKAALEQERDILMIEHAALLHAMEKYETCQGENGFEANDST